MGRTESDSNCVSTHRTRISVYLATTSSGPAADIEKVMTLSGLDQTSPGFIGPPVAHPFSKTGIGTIGIPWVIVLQYVINPPISLGTILSNAPIGETHGYNGNDVFLFIQYSIFTISSTIELEYKDILRFGLGPAIFITRCGQGIGETFINIKTRSKVGMLFDFGFSIPFYAPVYVDIGLQYRYVGKVDIGPFEANVGNSVAAMPLSVVTYNHILISAGFGIRF